MVRRLHQPPVFPQAPEDPAEENNNSVGLRVRYGAFTALLPGDAQEERRWWMDHVPELCAGGTLLKLSHHGSRNRTDSRWLDLVKPHLAVASLDLGNEYGHLYPEILALLERVGVPLLRNDRDGTTSIRTDGKRWEVIRTRPATRGPLGPATGGTASSTQEPGGKARFGGPRININTATVEELEALPGIGPVLAGRMIVGPPFKVVEDLDRVQGIGPKRLEKIRPLITAE